MALGIFLLRVCDMTMDTIRVLFVVRGKKVLAWILGFFQSLVFVVAISQVLTNLNNPLTVLGYAAGFATGIVIGMFIEGRLAIGHVHFTIISPKRGASIAESLRQRGFGVTEIPGRGMDGTVSLLHCNVIRKDVRTIEKIVMEADSEAVITAEDIRPVWRGFWRA